MTDFRQIPGQSRMRIDVYIVTILQYVNTCTSRRVSDCDNEANANVKRAARHRWRRCARSIWRPPLYHRELQLGRGVSRSCGSERYMYYTELYRELAADKTGIFTQARALT